MQKAQKIYSKKKICPPPSSVPRYLPWRQPMLAVNPYPLLSFLPPPHYGLRYIKLNSPHSVKRYRPS